MSAPPGFNPSASVLPDNPSAQIHVMRGGGGKSAQTGGFNEQDLQKLAEYGLEPGGIIADEIDELTKTAFLAQEKSGTCSKNSGDSIIMKKNCWAVLVVTRALINYHIRTSNLFKHQFPSTTTTPTKTTKTNLANTDNLDNSSSITAKFPLSTSTNSGEVPNPFLHPKKSGLENLKEKSGLTDNNDDDEKKNKDTEDAKALPISNSKDLVTAEPAEEPISKLDARLKLDVSKNDFYSDVQLKGKPTRFRGKVPNNITTKYKQRTSGGKRKSVYSNKTRKNNYP